MDFAGNRGASTVQRFFRIVFWCIGLFAAGLLALYVVGCVMIMIPPPEYTTEPLSLAETRQRFGEVDLPASATQIYYARSSAGFVGWLELYRFDAPLADCLAHGRHLLEKNQELARHDGRTEAATLAPLTAPPDFPHEDMLGAMRLSAVQWFDVETIQAGMEGHIPTIVNGVFWIDTKRGRFYYVTSD